MPYTQQQKKEHIMQLQKCLNAVSCCGGCSDIPIAVPDGVCGEDTRLAVKAFRHSQGLPETEQADSETWNRLMKVYSQQILRKPLPLNVFSTKDEILTVGCSGFRVYVVQALLKNLSDRFDNFPDTPVTGTYSENTAEAVKCFQKCCGEAPDGIVNCSTWNFLARCL